MDGTTKYLSAGVVLAAAACSPVVDERIDAAVQPDSRMVDAGMDAFTCANKPSNLTGRWRGENNASDDSGNSNNGTPVGATFMYAPGKHGTAFLFDGSTSAVKIDDGDALWPAASFSTELWVKTTSSAGTQTLIQKYQCGGLCPTGSYAYYSLRIFAGGNPAMTLRTDATPNLTYLTDTTHNIADGAWHHLVAVRDVPAGTMSLYLDGVVAATVTLPTEFTGALTNTDGETDHVTLGAGIVGGAQTFEDPLAGALDEVAFYKTALSPTQVAQIYAAPEGVCQ
jgi:hypothetical protein